MQTFASVYVVHQCGNSHMKGFFYNVTAVKTREDVRLMRAIKPHVQTCKRCGDLSVPLQRYKFDGIRTVEKDGQVHYWEAHELSPNGYFVCFSGPMTEHLVKTPVHPSPLIPPPPTRPAPRCENDGLKAAAHAHVEVATYEEKLELMSTIADAWQASMQCIFFRHDEMDGETTCFLSCQLCSLSGPSWRFAFPVEGCHISWNLEACMENEEIVSQLAQAEVRLEVEIQTASMPSMTLIPKMETPVKYIKVDLPFIRLYAARRCSSVHCRRLLDPLQPPDRDTCCRMCSGQNDRRELLPHYYTNLQRDMLIEFQKNFPLPYDAPRRRAQLEERVLDIFTNETGIRLRR